jgi:hypothetical protein
MRLLRARKIRLSLLSAPLVLVVCGLVWLGLRSTSKPAFLRHLKASAVFWTDGLGVRAEGPGNARLWISDATRRGLDLFQEYVHARQDKKLRIPLSYLLVLGEDSAYLDYATANTLELQEMHEFRMWTYILERDDSGLSASYAGKMRALVEELDLPYTRLFVARKNLRTGDAEAAIGPLLDVLASAPSWSGEAYKLLTQIEEPLRTGLLMPQLESHSVRGVLAAYVLAEVSERREDALQYLQAAIRSIDTEVAETARSVDAWLRRDPGSNGPSPDD